MRTTTLCFVAALAAAFAADADEISAVVRKAKVDVYAEPKLEAAKIDALKQDAAVSIAAQSGLWYEVKLPNGKIRVRARQRRADELRRHGEQQRQRARAHEWQGGRRPRHRDGGRARNRRERPQIGLR